MICPACNAEYVEGISSCADCGVSLVTAVPGAPEPDEQEWTRLLELPSETEAVLLQGALESAGISCQVESLKFHAEPVNFGRMSRVRIHVLREDLDDARALLAELGGPGDDAAGAY